MRKAFVFITAFAAVLIAGAAFAFMATPGGNDAAAAEEGVEKSTTTSTFHEEEPEKKEPPKEEKEEPKEEPKNEDPPKEEKKDEKDTKGPELVILHPEDGTHTTDIEVAYEGEVEPGATLHVGDREVEVGDEGHWRIVLPHELGANYHLFVAEDDAGNKTAAAVKVWRDEKEEPKEEKKEKPKEEPKEHEFWVKQKYGSCGEAEPYDKWYGEGAPGTEIWIVSDFGEGHTVIPESGEWFLTVYFNPETTPCGDEFGVVLETSEGHRKVFEFIRWCEEGGGEEGGHEEPPEEEEPPPEEEK